ncbi:MAG: ABC transporter substrate-binding protein, partial [Pseudoalteromonas sp.]|nr:ABC transporter substrate-binding protein [Pseudoalteromonas sp.]
MLANKFWQTLSRYSLCCVAFCICLIFSFKSLANTQLQSRWQQVESSGKDQSVYFYAWGGDAQINAYIQWAAEQVKAKYNIELVHVKLSDTSEAVSRVLAEKSANNHTQGSVDLIWINGANFAAMSKHGLLLKDWADKLPNFIYTNPENNPSVLFDFGLPTQGMEAPWGQASLTFYYDTLATSSPPQTLNKLLSWSKANPGRFSYPKPPDFLGMSFLKYALVVLHQHSDAMLQAKLNQPA